MAGRENESREATAHAQVERFVKSGDGTDMHTFETALTGILTFNSLRFSRVNRCDSAGQSLHGVDRTFARIAREIQEQVQSRLRCAKTHHDSINVELTK